MTQRETERDRERQRERQRETDRRTDEQMNRKTAMYKRNPDYLYLSNYLCIHVWSVYLTIYLSISFCIH